MNLNNSVTSYGKSCESMIQEIRDLEQKITKYNPFMTTAERMMASDQMAETRAKYRDPITRDAIGKWNQAKSNLRKALQEVEREKARNLNNWDAGKLANEMQVAKMRVDSATKSDGGRFNLSAIQSIISEANQSGDKYKQRAVLEAVQDLVSKVPAGNQDPHGNDARMVANRIAKEAGKQLEALNSSAWLEQAHNTASQRVQELNAAKSNLVETASVMGELSGDIIHNSIIIKALESVQQNNGKFIFEDEN